MANHSILGGKIKMISILFARHGSILQSSGKACKKRALKKSDSLLKELDFFYEKWYNGNERRGIEHAER